MQNFLSGLCRVAVVVPLAVLGCAATPPPEAPVQGQSFAEAMKLICDVDTLAGLAAEDDPISMGQKRNAWIMQKVDNPDGIYLRTMLSVEAASDQAVQLRQQAKTVGIEKCALADSVEKDGGGGLAP